MGFRQCALEKMGMKLFSDIFRGKRVLVTGHTGFKGSWLALWLDRLGAEVTGVALAPNSDPNHWELLGLGIDDRRGDIRDLDGLNRIFSDKQPEIVFHLAAQALVRDSYRDPVETWSSNVIGTVNVLEASRNCPSVKAVVVVTTDKCYENQEWTWGYREIDRLGGHDPYSASKAAAELVVASYRKSFFHSERNIAVATARAGNVIGGGDWSDCRLVPDVVRAIAMNTSLEIRSPKAIRPWQHVLEALSGYLMLGQQLLRGNREFADAWNFGPDNEGNLSVEGILSMLQGYWPEMRWHLTGESQPHESQLLRLDCSKACSSLNWHPVWNSEEAIKATAEWYSSYKNAGLVISNLQLDAYIDNAAMKHLGWTA